MTGPVSIPSFYRIFFTWVDPIIAFSSSLTALITPDKILHATFPTTVRTPSHTWLLTHLGGDLLNIGWISAVVLRYTGDVGVWRRVQMGILALDGVLMHGILEALRTSGRGLPSSWRGEDWGSVGLTATVGLVRACFLLGVGFPTVSARTGKRKL